MKPKAKPAKTEPEEKDGEFHKPQEESRSARALRNVRKASSRRARHHDCFLSPSSNASDSETESESNVSSSSTSAAGTRKTRLKKSTYPKYKVLFTEGYGKLVVRAVQSTELIDGKPHQPFFVAVPESSQYKPRKIAQRLSKKNARKWNQMKKILKDVFRKSRNPLVKDQLGKHSLSTFNWILKNESTSSDEDTEALQLLTTYEDATLHQSVILHALDIRSGFLNSFANPVGRQTLFALLAMCSELLPRELYCKLGVRNVGGRARGYEGSCTIGRFYKSLLCSDQEALDFLAECKEPEEGSLLFETMVPDGQAYARSHSKNLFSLTGKVKSRPETGEQSKKKHKKSNSAYRQTWLQALVGLSESNTTYGLLLTPDSGHIMELNLLKTGRTNCVTRLVTKDKEWSFLDNTTSDTRFSVNNLVDFLESVVDILLKG